MTARAAAAAVVLLLLALVVGWWLGRQRPSVESNDAMHVPAQGGLVTAAPPADAVPVFDDVVPGGVPPASKPGLPDSIVPGTPADPGLERRTLSGRVIDGRGGPLANHILRLSDVLGSASASLELRREREPETTTNADGHFTLTRVPSGARILRLIGPGDGDMPVLRRQEGSEVGIEFQADEGRITLAVPGDGLSGLEFVGPRHAEFWVQAQVDVEGRAPDEEPPTLWRSHLEMCTSAPDWNAAQDAEDRWWLERRRVDRTPGRIELQLAGFQHEVNGHFLVGADSRLHTVLVVDVAGYATQMRNMQGEQLFEQAGLILLRRVAGLDVAVRVPGEGDPIEGGVIELRETGGDLPDRVSRHGWYEDIHGLPDMHGRHVWSERSAGRYELRVTLPGYAPWTGSGELILGEPGAELPRVEVELVRAG